MGTVYLARDLDLDRDVAIKFISADRAADANARRRLIREARAAASLEHPNICAVHDVVVEPDGHAFIVMQCVEGETLSARLQRAPLDPRQTFLIAADVAAALSAAHKRGIIHRNVKPQNIIITPSGRAKLLDFGIARLDDAGVASPGDSTVTSLTGPGSAAGTPTYMSPEQVQQQPLDGRSHLFSLGAVVFQCLTNGADAGCGNLRGKTISIAYESRTFTIDTQLYSGGKKDEPELNSPDPLDFDTSGHVLSLAGDGKIKTVTVGNSPACDVSAKPKTRISAKPKAR